MTGEPEPGVDLYWLPLGAGGHSVRLNGRVFEAVAARLEGRTPCDLYHSALEVRVPEGRFVIDLAPHVPTAVWGRDELATGEMWNSNSLISWLIAGCGLRAESIRAPAGGRAPGWRAGLVVALRQERLPILSDASPLRADGARASRRASS
jgi:hypothetical protein